MAIFDPMNADPLTSKKLRYCVLVEHFGGSVFEWKRSPETEINFYLRVAAARGRVMRMNKETQRMIGAMR